MNICFIATRFFTGGFTSSMCSMIRVLAAKGLQVDVLLLEPEQNEFTPDLPASVRILRPQRRKIHYFASLFSREKRKLLLTGIRHFYFDARHASGDSKTRLAVSGAQFLMLFRTICGYEQKDLTAYDCVISWEENEPNMFLAEKALARYKIGFIHPDYEISCFDPNCDRLVLEKLDRINAISVANEQILKKVFPEFSDRISYIPNVINAELIREKSNEAIETFPKSRFDILTVCRLDNRHKAVDRAVRVAKRLNDDGLEFCWYVAGEGESRADILQLCSDLKVSNFILLGNQKNPYPLMKNADLFVLQSNYEGKPIAVDEAIIVGTPVVITDFASAHEQITNGVEGYIVPMEEEAIYRQIRDLIVHPDRLAALKSNLKAMSIEKYQDTNKFTEMMKHQG